MRDKSRERPGPSENQAMLYRASNQLTVTLFSGMGLAIFRGLGFISGHNFFTLLSGARYFQKFMAVKRRWLQKSEADSYEVISETGFGR